YTTQIRIEERFRNQIHRGNGILFYPTTTYDQMEFDNGDGFGPWDGWRRCDGTGGTIDLTAWLPAGLTAIQNRFG
ncbi:MAG: hypothetical protein D6772_10805, partial [Bacteroidetes bacterium]